MGIDALEAILRALGWSPTEGDDSVGTRAWNRVGDLRTIRTPRTDWVNLRIAHRIIKIASLTVLR